MQRLWKAGRTCCLSLPCIPMKVSPELSPVPGCCWSGGTKQTWRAGGSWGVFSILLAALRNTLGQPHFPTALAESPWPKREQSHGSATGTSWSRGRVQVEQAEGGRMWQDTVSCERGSPIASSPSLFCRLNYFQSLIQGVQKQDRDCFHSAKKLRGKGGC